MNPDRAIGLILALSVGAVLLLGGWLLWRAHQLPVRPEPPSAMPTTLATPSVAAPASPAETPATPAPAAAGRGFRLAGTVTGSLSYAIIVAPDGEHRLVQPGQLVPGLGRLTAVGEDSARIEGDDGELELRVAAAPTPTAAPISASPPPVTRITPMTSPPPGPSGSGSSPSGAPDRSAS